MTQLRQPPWENKEIMNSAIEVACDLRQIDPNVVRKQLEQRSPARVIDIAMAIAALVNVHVPLQDALKWTGEMPEADDCYALHKIQGRPKDADR